MHIVRPIFTFIICFILAQSLTAQQDIEHFQGAIKHTIERTLPEKLYVHTDKDLYLAGEILWFKIYCVNAVTRRPFDLSSIAYVEILDRSNRALAQAKVELANGSGNGSIALPITANSDVYRFRAYTHWMKNEGEEVFFQKPFTLINSLKPLEQNAGDKKGFHVTFFPEGGHLVQNLTSRLAFKITDAYGKGIEARGMVLNKSNDTIASFSTLRFGMGHFEITPKLGESYTAHLQMKDTTLQVPLPPSMTEGMVMRVTRDADSQLRVRVSSNTGSSEEVTLVIRNGAKVSITEAKQLSNGVVEFIVSRNKLSEGISQVTVFNKRFQPLCERLCFIQPVEPMIADGVLNAKEFGPRKRVEMKFNSVRQGSFSMSVHKVIGTLPSDIGSISSYVWLGSELSGLIESPDYYLSKEADVHDATENLLMTQGWRRFRWQDALAPKNDSFHFLPEYRDHIIHAKITNVKTGLPAQDVITYLSVPGRRVQLYTSKSDSLGRLKFYTTGMYGSNEMMLMTDKNEDSTHRIEVVTPFFGSDSNYVLPKFQLPAELHMPLKDANIAVQVQQAFSGEKLSQMHMPPLDSTGFFGPPDNSYNLDNYVRFSTMEEVLREYVTEVLVRRQKENFRLVMAGGVENRVFLDDPLTLFNGVPVFETNKVLQYDPLKIQKIDVVKRRYFYGPSTLNGIVNFISYQPDPELLSSLNAVVFDYDGIQYQREFYSPIYETTQQISSRMPDFRNVLYWSPSITTGEDGKASVQFYTSDMKGTFVAVIQGMNSDGKMGTGVFQFSVK